MRRQVRPLIALLVILLATATITDAEFAASKLREWRHDPVLFVQDVFAATPDDWQADMLRAYPTTDRLAMTACVGPGKSCCLAWITWNFLATRPHPKVAVTGITEDNLRDNLWPELAKWRARSDWLTREFEWTKTRVFHRGAPETWFASLRTWNRAADAEQQGNVLAGLHGDFVMALVDEAGGVPTPVVAAADGVLANPGSEAHVVISGNPTHLAGPLFDATHSQAALWRNYRVTGDPDDPRRAPRVRRRWALDMIQKYGRDSTYVRVRVFGKFPRQAADAIIGLDQMEDSYGRLVNAAGDDIEGGLVVLGVDVARFGDDRTVVTIRDGQRLVGFDDWQGKDTVYTANRVANLAMEHKAEIIRVDDIGVGGGVTDNLMNWDSSDEDVMKAWDELGATIDGVNVGQAATALGPDGKPMYADLRTQLAMEMADWFKTGDISIDRDAAAATSLEAEATDIRYGFDRRGKLMQLEPKDEYKKRHGGQSPDYWDATVLAFTGTAEAGDVLQG